MLGTIFADPGAAQELLNNAPRSVLEKIRDFIFELLDTISAAARRITGAKDLAALTELEGWAQDMAKMLDAAMSETGRRTAEITRKQDMQSALASERYAIREGVSISREEMQQNMAEVAQMEPVVTLGGHEFDLNAGPLAAQVTEYFNGLGNQVENPVLGTITLNRRGVKDSLSHGIGQLKATGFYAVPAVLEKGRIIDYRKNWKERGYDTFLIAAPIAISDGANKGSYYIGAIVTVSRNTNRYYLHEVVAQKSESMQRSTGAAQVSGLPGDASTLTVKSILEKLNYVNRETTEIKNFSLGDMDNSIGPKREGDSRVPDAQLSLPPDYTANTEHESAPSATIIAGFDAKSNTSSEISEENSPRYSLFDESADASQLLSENERLRRLHETFASNVGDVSRYKGESSREAADISSGKPTAHGGCLALRLRNSSGEQPMMARKVLWKKVVSLYPTRSATSLMGMAVLASRRQLALMRTCLTNSEKVTPISCLKCLLR